MNAPNEGRTLAVFIDLENLALGFENQKKPRFDIHKVLERLVEKGKIIVKKAYCDWSRYQAYTVPFHEEARPVRTQPTSVLSSTRWIWPGASLTSTPL